MKMKLPYDDLKTGLVCKRCHLRALRYYPSLVDIIDGDKPLQDENAASVDQFGTLLTLSRSMSLRLTSEEV